MKQRSVSDDELAYVVEYGKVYDRAGARWYVMRRKDIPEVDRSNRRIDRTDGVVVCVEDDVVSTVYRNERPSIHIRKKTKYGWRMDSGESKAA